MKQLIFIAGIFFCSCSNTSTSVNDNNIVINELLKNDYNIAINELLKKDLKNVDLVVLETKPVHRGDILDGSPKIGYAYLKYYAQRNIIKLEDIEYIY